MAFVMVLLNTSLSAPTVFASAGRFSTRPVTIPSISAILASSKPWERQPLNLRQSTPFCISNPVSIISRMLDFPAPPVTMHSNRDGPVRALAEQSYDRGRDRLVVE
jgi:hypothetical protein